ncbi:AbrB family transcriptional regulator [Sporosarcina sp. ACRSM]|uniref:AbrB family transcriptional regulator n=1 Tax=Sporosarcina sp. ACRSM TaxID=2918216 RepID=UPI00210490B6|nr:AbrB family transcriptional regulator [Sporosarcina sp. ACRSM]
MSKKKELLKTSLFVLFSGMGGFLLSFTGIPVGWMIGTLLTATLLFIFKPKFLKISADQKGIPKYWMAIGQCILGIELGQKMNDAVYFIFLENWLTITTMLLLSIIFALLSGLVLWKFSNLDMLTSFFSTAPGGLSTIPGIAEEVGANTGVVSIIQTMRIFLVVLSVPLVLSLWVVPPVQTAVHIDAASIPFQMEHLLATALLVGIACLGYYLGVFLKFPAPWLIGSMVAVAIVKSFSSIVISYQLVSWWPSVLIIFSQVIIGASIGSRIHKDMFIGLKKTLAISFLSTTFLIVSMFFCAYLTTRITDLSFVTSALAFAPGGIAEMTTTAIVLDADSTFVVAVQVLRVISVCVILPPFFRLLNYWDNKKGAHSEASA